MLGPGRFLPATREPDGARLELGRQGRPGTPRRSKPKLWAALTEYGDRNRVEPVR